MPFITALQPAVFRQFPAWQHTNSGHFAPIKGVSPARLFGIGADKAMPGA
jgi:hypothetical protein